MTNDQPFTLDPSCPSHSASLHALRNKRMVRLLALRKAQSEVRDLTEEVEYLDYRIEIARKCVQDELRNCEVSATADFYQP